MFEQYNLKKVVQNENLAEIKNLIQYFIIELKKFNDS